MTINLQIQHFKLAFGSITFCTKALSPNFDIEIKKEKKPAKEEKKQPEKKEKAKKEAQSKKEAAKPKETPAKA